MASLWSKLRETWRFLRYGPTQFAQWQRDSLQRDEEGLQRDREAAQALAERAGALQAQLEELTRSVMQKAADVDLQYVRQSLGAELRRETGWLRDRLSALDVQVSKAGAGPVGAAANSPAASTAHAAAEQAFYLALEQQFRGTREQLRARLQPYRPWLEGLPEGPIADLGCGRGEWMELLREWGFQPVGIDLNSLHVQHVQSLGFPAECGDAIAWLQQQPDASLAAISSFHVVEHLPMGLLLTLVDQARRTLKPGGRLILETPNPENLGVATQSFWLDPTHLRPLPPALLALVAEHAGLSVESVLRLNPPPDQAVADETLRSLLLAGRDYAVVARKPGAEAT